MFATAPATTSTVNEALRIIDSSTSGHCTRFSTMTKSASAASDPANATTVDADSQAHCSTVKCQGEPADSGGDEREPGDVDATRPGLIGRLVDAPLTDRQRHESQRRV